MKFLIFASCIHIDILSQKGVEKFVDEVGDFHCMAIPNDGGVIPEEEFLTSLKKIERYGSFSFISKVKYNELLQHSDE